VAAYTFENANTVGDTISSNLFGGNIRADKDDISGGTFSETTQKLGITSLRYPGGGVTETVFDVENPDSGLGVWGQKVIPISDFIAFTNENSIDPTVVVPSLHITTRSTDLSGLKIINDEALGAIRTYVSDIMGGKYGQTDISIFEIGNEFYNESNFMTAADYGNVAGIIATVISEEINQFKLSPNAPTDWVEPKIFVQSGRTMEESEQILGQLDAGERSKIDGVTAHTYPWSYEGFFGDITEEKFEVMDQWSSEDGFGDLEYFISEWNIGSPNGEDGLAQASSILAGIETMVRHGVDYASVWPLQAATENELDSPEGKPSALRVAGEVFDMISESVVGTTLLDLDSGSTEFKVQGFEGPDKVVLFVSSRTLDPLDLELDVSGLIPSFSHAWGEKISAVTWSARVEDPTLHKTAMPYVQTYSNPTYFDLGTETLHLDGYEIMRLVFATTNTGALLEGQEEIASLYSEPLDQSDSLYGGRFGDVIKGFVGNDNLFGNGGSDHIYGGNGEDNILGGRNVDSLYGENGRDFMKGNSGDDELFGGLDDDFLKGGTGEDKLLGEQGQDTLHAGAGNDCLFGGSGNDQLRGGDGNDILDGGLGNDQLFGGEGDDVFVFRIGDGNDKIRAFEDGVDLINIEDEQIDFSDLSISNSNNGAVISFSAADIKDSMTLTGVDAYLLTTDDFLFG